MENPSVTVPKVKIPQQKRSREKYEAMVHAAEKLFAKNGVKETSVQDIVQEAGVSVGAFYQRFENKEAIIHTIFYLLEEEMMPVGEALGDNPPKDLHEAVKRLVELTIASALKHRSAMLAMLLEVERNPNIREYVSGLRRKLGMVYTEVLKAHQDEIAHPNFKRSVAMINRMVNSYILQVMLYKGYPATEKALRFSTSDKELVTMIMAYLTYDQS